VISDHTFDLAKFTGSELVFTGKGTRGLVFNNSREAQVTFKDALIDNASTGVTLKFDKKTQKIKLAAINSKLLGKVGNSASQMIYFLGEWSDVAIDGFEIDQRRDSKTGSTETGACVQLQGVIKAGHNLGDVSLTNMILRNCGDEPTYVNHFQREGGYVQGNNLRVDNVRVYGSGRDYFQQWGFRNVHYSKCYGENGMKEADSNHWSAFSMNGDTDTLLIEDCEFKGIAQLIYSGAPTSKIEALIRNVKFTEGTHAGSRPNSSAYLKGPGKYIFENCVIDAPNVMKGAISADGCDVLLKNTTTNAKKIEVPYNGGHVTVDKPVPVPVVTHRNVTVDEKTTVFEGKTTVQYFLEGKELTPVS